MTNEELIALSEKCGLHIAAGRALNCVNVEVLQAFAAALSAQAAQPVAIEVDFDLPSYNKGWDAAIESMKNVDAILAASQPAVPGDKPQSDDELAISEECARLQVALAFWLPDVPSPDHPLFKRIADDSYLLAGLIGPDDEKSAQEQGLVTLNASVPGDMAATGGGEKRDAERYRYIRTTFLLGSPEALDAKVDAAMSARPQGGET